MGSPLVEAILDGDFDGASGAYEAISREERVRRTMRLVGKGVRTDAILAWKPTLFERFATLVGIEGLKGPWCAYVEDQRVVVGFDIDIAVQSTAMSPRVSAALRSAGLLPGLW